MLVCAIGVAAGAAELPYNEKADAHADLVHAMAKAKELHKNVLVVFGANWCHDCLVLDKALHGPAAARIEARFVVVKIDVGNFDRNINLAQSYGNPIRKGIPSAVMLTPDNVVIYATVGGELANARRMGETGIFDFFSRVSVTRP
jgi:protein disulfide-isomerase